MSVTFVYLIAVLLLAVLVLQVVLLLRGRGDGGMHARLDSLRGDSERLERALREEQRAGREELQQGFERFRVHVGEQLGGSSQQQRERIEGFAQRLDALTERTELGLQSLSGRLTEEARKSREELVRSLAAFGEQQHQRLAALTADNEKRLAEVRATLESKLKAIQDDNAVRLEQMRATVDEKLHATLETRLGESFKLVSERLELVQRGLGEMQQLANGVGDLKRVLTNVKKRGMFGETQLAALLEDMLAPDQYAANVSTVPGSNERVEFAIRMPGSGEGEHVFLPIDAKFPVEDYQRLLDAQEAADAEAAAAAGRALETCVREEARRIVGKYVSPPHTTDFAVLYLPTEGLYAEVIRRPGLFENLQREFRITLAGPTTLSALLNSLQMGFRTLAIAKRSSEVWKVLGAVKTEFGKFGDVLDKVKKKLDEAGRHIDATGVRTRAIERRLRDVETLPGGIAQELLGAPALPDGEEVE